MLPAMHLGGSRTEQDPQSKAHTAACLVSPSRAGPIETHTLVVRKFDTIQESRWESANFSLRLYISVLDTKCNDRIALIVPSGCFLSVRVL